MLKLKHITPRDQANKVSESELIKALQKVHASNIAFRKSWKFNRAAMSIRAMNVKGGGNE